MADKFTYIAAQLQADSDREEGWKSIKQEKELR